MAGLPARGLLIDEQALLEEPVGGVGDLVEGAPERDVDEARAPVAEAQQPQVAALLDPPIER